MTPPLVQRRDPRAASLGTASCHFHPAAGDAHSVTASWQPQWEGGVEGFEFCCADHAQAGEACVEKILRTHPETTAVATINEAALPGVQRALERAGLTIPSRFSITGVAARRAEQFHPQLTATDVPAMDMGAIAVRFLIERIAEPDTPPRQELLTPPISLRSSTGPAAAQR